MNFQQSKILQQIDKLKLENKEYQEIVWDMKDSFISEKMRNYLVSNNEIVAIKQLCQQYDINEFDFLDTDNLYTLKFILGNKYRNHDGTMKIILMFDEVQEVVVYSNYLLDYGTIDTNNEKFTLSRNCSNIDLMRFYDLLRSNIDNITNTLYREIKRKLSEEQLRMKSDIEFFKEFKQKYKIGE